MSALGSFSTDLAALLSRSISGSPQKRTSSSKIRRTGIDRSIEHRAGARAHLSVRFGGRIVRTPIVLKATSKAKLVSILGVKVEPEEAASAAA
jgi:hypothetical protein